MKLFFYDLETTGTSPFRNGIHQISGMIEIDGVVKEEFNYFVQPNPDAKIEESALQVGGVTKEQIMAYPPMADVYGKIVKMLEKYVDKFNKTDKFHLVGYNNAAFDNPFFRTWFAQNGDRYFGSWFWADTIDVMVMASYALAEHRGQLENFKLATVAAAMGVEVKTDDLHNAMYDIMLTKAVFDKITNR